MLWQKTNNKYQYWYTYFSNFYVFLTSRNKYLGEVSFFGGFEVHYGFVGFDFCQFVSFVETLAYKTMISTRFGTGTDDYTAYLLSSTSWLWCRFPWSGRGPATRLWRDWGILWRKNDSPRSSPTSVCRTAIEPRSGTWRQNNQIGNTCDGFAWKFEKRKPVGLDDFDWAFGGNSPHRVPVQVPQQAHVVHDGIWSGHGV